MYLNLNLMTFKILLFLMVICLSGQNADAQICLADTLTVNSLSGVAVLNNQTALKEVRIQLRTDHHKNKLIAETITDSNGKFSFDEKRPGKYQIVVEGIEGLVNLTTGIRLRKSSPNKTPLGIKIELALIFTGDCSNVKPFELEK